MYKIAAYKFAKKLQTLLLLSVLLCAGLLLFGTKHAAAISDNFPRGHSVDNEWVMLSQYQCPGHCLDTPDADVRIFYQISTLDSQGVRAGDNLQVYTQVDCRYSGTPDGSASLSGGTSRPGWPGITCTGLNSPSVGSTIRFFSVQRQNLNCSQSGATGKYTGWCYADLNLHVNNTAGNQPVFGVWINTGDGLGNVRITAQEESSPTQNYTNVDCYTGAAGSCAVPSGANLAPKNHLFTLWNNFNNDGPGTHHSWDMRFAPDCSVKSSQTVYLRWYDADDPGPGGNNGTQSNEGSGEMNFDLYDETAGSYIFQNRTGLGSNDSYRDLGFTVKPNHKYRWSWNYVSATNGIQLWMPYSEIGTLIDCPSPTGGGSGDNRTGSASCSASVDNGNPYIGQNVTITVTYKNESTATDWWTGGIQGKDYDGDGTADYSNNPINGNEPPGMPAGGRYANSYPKSGNSLGYPDIVDDKQYTDKQHSGVFLETGQAGPLNSPLNTSRLGRNQTSFGHTYVVSNSNVGTPITTYHFGIRNDETGAYFPTGNPQDSRSVCDVTVNWQLLSLTQFGCSTTSVYNPGNVPFYLVFFDAAGGVVHNTGFDPGAPYGGSPSWDTFNNFRFLVPHNTYNIVAYQWGSNAPLDSASIPLCMSASCQTTINADLEPGQTGSVNYGLYLSNYTNRPFNAGEYAVQAIANPGLSGSGTTPIALNPGGPVAYNATFNMTANYTGSVSAHLLYGGGNIDGALLISCSAPYTPNTRPSLKVTQGDISVGGGFRYLQASGTQQCTLTSRRYFAPITAGGDESVGGIRTFAATAPYVSSAQFAAYALGLIHSPGGPDNVPRYGFFSDSTNKFVSKLTFANVGMTGGNLGGNLGGQFIDAHCAPDYFNETSNTLNPTFVTAGAGILNPDSLPLTPDGTGQFYYQNSAGTPVKIGGTLSNNPAYPRKRVTIFVNGDVLITNNITYGPWNFDLANKTNNSPYLTIIAKGNISVNFSVSRMDGVYIAQPLDDVGVTKGAFYSCSIAGAVPSSNQVKTNCRNSLSVNGSVIAQHVHLLRSQGTLQDGTGDAAENFNYAPSTVIGLPSFRPNCGSVVTYCIGSLNSLPPVF
jgi:hypothetical protein